MLNKLLFPLTVAGLLTVGSAFGSEANQYCNDLYPADSYEPEERSQYIQECLSQYADDETYQDETTEADAEPEADYYEGTVEDYVEDVAPTEAE